jgi:hypothetical protein
MFPRIGKVGGPGGKRGSRRPIWNNRYRAYTNRANAVQPSATVTSRFVVEFMLDTVQDCTILVRDINHEDDSTSPCHCPFILPRPISPNVGLLRRRIMKSALRFEASNRGIHFEAVSEPMRSFRFDPQVTLIMTLKGPTLFCGGWF